MAANLLRNINAECIYGTDRVELKLSSTGTSFVITMEDSTSITKALVQNLTELKQLSLNLQKFINEEELANA